jgi:hypothetical protein
MVQVRTVGAEKQHCTIMLAISGDRQKLPPYVIFKHKAMAEEEFSQEL